MPTRLNIPTATVNAFRRSLPRWYRRHKRDLPWRRTRDPYHIWVSEIMLQQTRVETVIPYYRRWLREFPTVASLARAPLSRVLKLWEGLGYYQRARNLHRAARQMRQTFQRSLKSLSHLPGVGSYTAAAIASIAFGERMPVVDGNVARVLARVFRIRDNVRKPSTQKKMTALAQVLMPAAGGRASRQAAARRKTARQEPRPPNTAGEFNQAMMELGALVCLPVNPRCEECPLRWVCDGPSNLPNRGAMRPAKRVALQAAAVVRGGRLLIRQRAAQGQLAGLWELPAWDEKLFDPGNELLVIRHTITNRRITLRLMAARLRRRLPAGSWRWAGRAEVKRLAFSAAHRRAVQFALSWCEQKRAVCVSAKLHFLPEGVDRFKITGTLVAIKRGIGLCGSAT